MLLNQFVRRDIHMFMNEFIRFLLSYEKTNYYDKERENACKF
jgi:hypothetical protein